MNKDMMAMLNRIALRIIKNPQYQFLNDTEYHILQDDLEKSKKTFEKFMDSDIMLYDNYIVKTKEIFYDLAGTLKKFSARFANNTASESDVKKYIDTKIGRYFKDSGKKELCVRDFAKKYIFFRKVLPDLSLSDLKLYAENGTVVMKIEKVGKAFKFSQYDNQTGPVDKKPN